MAKAINLALQTKPEDGSTQWSARSLAAAMGISKTAVHRWQQTFSVQPHPVGIEGDDNPLTKDVLSIGMSTASAKGSSSGLLSPVPDY